VRRKRIVHVAIEGRQLRSVPLARIEAMANAGHNRPAVEAELGALNVADRAST
jgi:hypothetical protein